MTTLKERLWKDYRISSERAEWHKFGAVITLHPIEDINEVAVKIADKTGCDICHLGPHKLRIDGFE